MWFRRGSKGSYYLTFVNHVLMEDAMTFWEIRKELEVEDVDWEGDDARKVYVAWSEHKLRMEDMKDLDLRWVENGGDKGERIWEK